MAIITGINIIMDTIITINSNSSAQTVRKRLWKNIEYLAVCLQGA